MNAEQFEQFLQELRIDIYERFTEGTDTEWEECTDFVVEVGSKLADILNLDITVTKSQPMLTRPGGSSFFTKEGEYLI